jgi:hypothetical protein
MKILNKQPYHRLTSTRVACAFPRNLLTVEERP